jgi:hypothetical protein
MQYLDQAFPQSFPAIHMKAVTEKEIYEIQKLEVEKIIGI